MFFGSVPENSTAYPLFALSFIVLWGCFQLITGWTVNHFATERATLQWLTLAAVYYAGITLLKEESLAERLRTGMVWFGFTFALEAILQAYLSPGKVFGLFPTGYHDFVMGTIVYHTHFAVLIETILPIALFLSPSARPETHIPSWEFRRCCLRLWSVSASRGGLIIACMEVVAVVVLAHLRKPKASRRIGYLALILAGVTVILILIVGFETVSERFYSEALTLGRIQFAKSTLHMIAERPWIGWGLGCWPAVYPAFATFDPGAIVNQAHSGTGCSGLPKGAYRSGSPCFLSPFGG